MKIEKLIKNNCCGCGTCSGVCPKIAISMKINKRGFYIPKTDENKCINCKLCKYVCPILNKQNISDSKNVIGIVQSCYIGYSKDKKIRFNSSSGGIISQILISALQDKFITGAIVTKMNKENPLSPEIFIARNKKEILSASGSKYCPVPLNIILKQIISSKPNEKFAIVGLPCQIEGIKKAVSLIPKIKNKIVIYLGIFCGGTRSFIGTDFLIKHNNLNKLAITSFSYRGGGWPGNMEVKFNDEKEFNIPLIDYYSQLFGMFFKNKACLSCNDYTNELADISCGDAWGLEKNDNIGTSLIISRNKFGDSLLKRLQKKNKIFLKEITMEQVISSKTTIIFKKKLPFKLRKLKIYKLNELQEIILASPTLNYLSTYRIKFVRNLFCNLINFIIKIKSNISGDKRK